MNIIEVETIEELSEQASRLLLNKIKEKPSAVLGLATGGTPMLTYRRMIEESKRQHISFRQVRTFNLDEYVGLDREHPASYAYYMNQQLFDHVDIPDHATHIPDGTAQDLKAECIRYEQAIEAAGGIDLQLLGIGRNGHIGFNEPGTPFTSITHVVELTESTRTANSCYFSHPSEVPTHAVTMGINTIMQARDILLIVSGAEKAEVLDRLIRGPVDEELPASILQRHPHVTVIADRAALGKR